MKRNKNKREKEIAKKVSTPCGELKIMFYDYNPEHLFGAKYFSVTGYFCFFASGNRTRLIRTEFLVKEFKNVNPIFDYEMICYN